MSVAVMNLLLSLFLICGSVKSSQDFIWEQIGNNIYGEAEKDVSGQSISISSDGNRIAIGAENNDGNGPNSGHTRVFELQAGSWVKLGNDIDGEHKGDLFGSAVSLSANGNRVAIGAKRYGNTQQGAPGQVCVYELVGRSWVQMGSSIDGKRRSDALGQSVSLSTDGSRIAVGGTNYGVDVLEYDISSKNWVQIGDRIRDEEDGDETGFSVSLSAEGNRVVVGAPKNDGRSIMAGHARVFELQNGLWKQLGRGLDGDSAGQKAGWSVSISNDGNRVAVGAPVALMKAGLCRVYELQNGDWAQLGSDIAGDRPGDLSGASVSLSGDGNTVAVGAYRAYGDGALDSGRARILQYVSGAWISIAPDINGTESRDEAGFAVSLSGDGSYVAVSAISAGTEQKKAAGQTRVFELRSRDKALGSDSTGESPGGDSATVVVDVSVEGEVKEISSSEAEKN